MLTQAPKGTRDLMPQEAYRWHHVEAIEREVAAQFGFEEVRTPIFEHTELFLRSVGDTTDIVQKEMYTFTDKGERSITLRPEGTAGVARAFVEHKLFNEPLPAKMFYLSYPVFRYENPQSGRLRQHHQFGVEVYGAQDAACDAEVILLAATVLSRLGIGNLTLKINSIGCPECRARYNQALKDFLGARLNSLCKTCQERFERNPLRILDCKESACQAQLDGVPTMLEYLCDDCKAHFDKLQGLLAAAGQPAVVDPFIVRGLDYYTRTVFEFVADLNGPLTVCGGGRYDGLMEQVGGPALPGMGFGMGIERLLMAMDTLGIAIDKPVLTEVFLCGMGEAAVAKCFTLTDQLRRQGVRAQCDLMGRSLKAQLKYANKQGCPFTAILGEDEMNRGVIKLKDMAAHTEEDVPFDQLAERIRR
ncbi:MAG: histidine--tRNA ligase [Christensenellales bacterium]|jgi:histidyl-tRNA synthetase